MKYTALLVVLLWVAFATTASAQQTPQQGRAGQTIQGCLSGDQDGYWLRQHHGTEHILIGDYSELGAHVGQFVQLTGQRDRNRDASASSDQGIARGQRFFQVWSVTQIQGKCGK